jgi:hypothetical protein
MTFLPTINISFEAGNDEAVFSGVRFSVRGFGLACLLQKHAR